MFGRPAEMKSRLFTIGHSNHELDAFVRLLRGHGVEVLIDVRSQPSSKYSPQFNRGSLRHALPPTTRYAFMGDALGGRPPDGAFYDSAGHVLYGPLSRSPQFLGGIEAIERNRGRYTMALLCSEGDPLACHRFLLVTRVLVQRGWDPREILHILPGGSARAESELAYQGGLLEETWRSPLSVLPNPAHDRSSEGFPEPAFQPSSIFD